MNNDEIIVEGNISSSIPVEEEFIPYNPLNRPKMHYVKPLIALVVFIAQFIALCVIPYKKWWVAAIVLSVYSIIYIAVIAKKAIIWMVHLYQNLASDETRLKCVFEPSCSEYMILSVEKYGVIKGTAKGVNRLCRCGREHGVDYP